MVITINMKTITLYNSYTINFNYSYCYYHGNVCVEVIVLIINHMTSVYIVNKGLKYSHVMTVVEPCLKFKF